MTIAQPMSGSVDAPVTIRKIDTKDLWVALAEGWRDFRAMRGDILVVSLIYPVMGLIVVALALNSRLVPLAFPLCAGLSLLGPVVAIGFYELARRREQGEETGWSHFIDGFTRRNDPAIAGATLVLAIIFLCWLGVAWIIYNVTFGPGTFDMWKLNQGDPVTLQHFVASLFTTREGWTLILLGNAAGAGFALLVLAVSLVTFPMLVDRPIDMFTAVRTSLHAFAANRAVLFRWGIMVAALLVLGAVPLFIGLAVVLPVLGYATWHLYRKLVEH